MAEEPIQVFEITRILIADSPWHFLAEVILRSIFMFVFALIFMRFLGRRAIHQLTSFDLLLIIALGSAMGDPMIYPDVAILWSVFGILTIMVLYRIQNALANRFPRYEDRVSCPRSVFLVRQAKVSARCRAAWQYARPMLD